MNVSIATMKEGVNNPNETTEITVDPIDQTATIAQITLNRPKDNAMGIEMIQRLRSEGVWTNWKMLMRRPPDVLS